MGETFRLVKERNLEPEKVSFAPEHLATLIQEVERGSISNQTAKEVFEKIFDENVEPVASIEAHGLRAVEDADLLEEVLNKVIAANEKAVEEFKSGKEKVLGFLVGQVMKEMKGKANAGKAGALLREKLKG